MKSKKWGKLQEMGIPSNLERGTGLKRYAGYSEECFSSRSCILQRFTFNQEKKKVYYIEELENKSLPPPPSPYRQQDGHKCDRRSDLAIDSMDKFNNVKARENCCCLQYHILVHLEEIHLEICLDGRCSYCPMKDLEWKACFKNVLTSYQILSGSVIGCSGKCLWLWGTTFYLNSRVASTAQNLSWA